MDPKRTVKGRFAQPNSRNLLLALFLSCSLSLGCADKVLAQELSDQEKIAQLEKVVLQQQTLIERLEKRLTVIESKEAEIAPTSTNSITPVNSSHPDSSSVAVNGRPTATASESTSPSQTAPSSPTAVPTTNVVTSKFPVQLYGMVKVDTIYDSSEVDNSNVMRLVKQERNSGPDDDFAITAKESRLGINISGPQIDDWLASGKMEGDFYGNLSEDQANPRMRLAYLDLASGADSFRIGQDWFTQQIVLPKSVNFGVLSNQGAQWGRKPLIRYSRVENLNGTEKLNFKIGASRTIGKDLDGAGQDDGVDSGVPTFDWNVHYSANSSYNRPLLAGLSGHYGTETLDVVDAAHKDIPSWSLIGSALLPLSAQWDLAGTIWTGSNLDAYQAGIGQGINQVRMIGIQANGGWAQLRWEPSPQWNWNIVYGTDNPSDGDLELGNPSKNSVCGSNLFYKLDPAVTIAGEYLYVETEYKDQGHPHTHRIQSAVYYNF